jgi:hypothetical protein
VTGTFLVGHGADPGETTFVPDGMTVHLYADEGEAIPAPNVIEILRYRGRQSVRTLTGGDPIQNLYLTPLTRNQYETELGAVQDGETVCFIGYDPPVASTTGYALCMDVCSQGVHNCFGLFGVFRDVTDLHLVICLEEIVYAEVVDEEMVDEEVVVGEVGEVGGEAVGEETPEADAERKNLPWEQGEPEHYNRIAALADSIVKAADYDPKSGEIKDYENAAAAKIFDDLDHEDQAKLMTYEVVQRWSYVRYARQTLTQLGADRFAAWCNSQQDWVKEIYRTDTNVVGQYLT